MDVQSPSTLLAAWFLAPLLTVLAAGGLGAGIASASGFRLRALTLPVGYLAGVVTMVALLKLGVGGRLAVAVTALLAASGALLAWRGTRPSRGRMRAWVRDAAPAGAAGAGAFALAMAPLAGSGRSGVLGYILNNDPAVHSSLVEHLRAHGSSPGGYEFASSWTQIGYLPDQGYPLGSHVWALFAGTATRLETFHVWTPSVAIAASMLALVAFAALRRGGAGAWPAAAAAAVVPAGYLFFSFVVQGSAKEVLTAVAVYAAITLAAEAVDDGLTWRRLPVLAVAPAAAFLAFGAGAASWLVVPVAGFLALGAWRARRYRPSPRIAAGALIVLGAAVAVAVPAVREALDYVRSAEGTLRNPAQYGNLLGPVPWEQAFNVWFAYDYRVQPPTYETLSEIGPWVAGAFAAAGVGFAAYRREIALPLIVLSGVVGALVISNRYSIYLDTKAYAVLGPALGIATAAGVLALLRGPVAARFAGAAAGALLAVAVLGGAALVYAGVWVTPEGRFEELGDIAERFDGEGPLLVNEREEWDYYLLRDLEPIESWGVWQPRRGFRIGEEFPPFLPHTPDFDDYSLAHVRDFELLLDRKGPGGSLPPSNYEVVHETPHYRLWRRAGPSPEVHLALGLFELDNAARLDCRRVRVQRLLRRARTSGRGLIASVPEPRTRLVLDNSAWRGHELRGEVPPDGMINRRGGSAGVAAVLAAGDYDAWIQGSFGPGVGLHVGDRGYGSVFGDLGLPSAWHHLGRVRIDRRVTPITVLSLTKPAWQSGSQRSDLTGALVFAPAGRPARTERVPPSRLRSLCGRRLDWLELPA